MYNSETKTWNAPPPSYDCIIAKESNRRGDNCRDALKSAAAETTPNILKQYMTISDSDIDSEQNGRSNNVDDHPNGLVCSLSEFMQRFGSGE